MGRPRWKRRTDEALLLATQRDGAAFGEFYTRHERRILLYVLRRTRNPEVAADLTAEVFAAALVSSATYEPRDDTPAVAWLFAIARNTVAESYRKARVVSDARRRLQMDVHELDDTLVEQLGILAGTTEGDRVLELLDALPPDQHDAVRAVVLDERPYGDVAADLQCSEAVIRKRVSRGLTTIRSQVNRT